MNVANAVFVMGFIQQKMAMMRIKSPPETVKLEITPADIRDYKIVPLFFLRHRAFVAAAQEIVN